MASSYDLVIKNGTIFTGKIDKPLRADVGIKKGKIEDIGDLSKSSADSIIDASNLYVSPGFIDLTNHSDTHWTLFNNPMQESMIFQGATTLILGNCSYSLAPIVKDKGLEGIQKWVDITKININWQGLEEYLNELSKLNLGVNVATLIGYGTLRRGIMKETNRPASAEELNQMQFMLETGLKQGAFGMSTSLGRAHARFANPAELIGLFRTLKDYNAVGKHHLKDEGMEILPALSQLINIMRSAEGRAHISHFKLLGKRAWQYYDKAEAMIDSAIKEEVKLSVDIFPYTKTGSTLYLLLPPWVLEGPKENILKTIKDPEKRPRVIEGLKKLTLHYDKITVASTLKDTTPIGKSISELSETSGITPEEVILNLLETNDIKVSIFSEAIAETHLLSLVKKAYTCIASDGVGLNADKKTPTDLPHPRSFGSFPKALNFFVKERGALSWEEAIYKMTYLPAKIIGLQNRGVIQKGAFADIVIFNPETIKDTADYKNPFSYPQGIEHVIVNGMPALQMGKLAKRGAGAVLKKS